MKSLKKSILLILIALFVAFSSVGVITLLTAPQTQVKAMSLESQNTVQKEYVLGTYFDLPTYQFSNGTTSETASTVLYSPSGKAYDAARVQLKETGLWTLRFTAFGEETFDISFTVYNSTYHVSSSNGSVALKEHNFFPKSGEGLVVSIPKGASFKYNEVIDLKGLTSADNIIELGIFPNSMGVADVASVSVYLTDIYDSSNYIEYRFVNPAINEDTYGGVSCVGATFTGAGVTMALEKSDSISAVETWQCDSSFYGAYTPFSFNGNTSKTGGDPITALSYDYEKMECHSNTKRWYSHSSAKTLIADLDRINYGGTVLKSAQKTFEKAFEGFTTGEVYLSIQANGYSSNTCNLFIKSIIKANFNQNKSYDKNDPYIDIDFGGAIESQLPNALVNNEYSVFNAIISDNELEDLRLFTKVYYIYQGSRVSRYSIVNGKFTPDLAGTYEIVYQLTDGYGNHVERSVFVQAVSSIDKPVITLPSSIKTEYLIDEIVTIPAANVQSFSGVASLEVDVTFNNQPVQITDDKFTLNTAGEYVITYTATDYVGQVTTKKITLSANFGDGKPVLTKEPVVPIGFIHGAIYTLQTPVGYYYDNGVKKECLPIIKVTEGSREKTLENGSYTADGTNISEVTIEYTYQGSGGNTVRTFTKRIISAVNFPNDLKNYFIASGMSEVNEVTKNGVLLKYTGEGEVSYVKAVPVKEFNMQLRVYQKDTTLYNFGEGIEIYLTDTLNTENAIKIAITKGAETKTFITVNDGREYDFTASFSSNLPFSVSFSSDQGCVYAGTTKIPVTTFANGAPFTGFNNAKAYLSLKAINADDFRFTVETIGNQGYTTLVDGDFLGPTVFVDGELSSSYDIGAVVNLPVLQSIDLLQENVYSTLSVESPSGKIVLNNVAGDVSHQITLEEYGVYKLTYKGYDINEMANRKSLSITVNERIAPVLTLSEGDFTCDLGEEIELPYGTFSDNISSADKIEAWLSYLSPQGYNFLIETVKTDNTYKPTSKFTFNEVGLWELNYMVFDESYNVTVKTVRVNVVDAKAIPEKEPERNISFMTGGESNYFILIPETVTSSEVMGAEAIQSYIYQATGFNLPIKNEADYVVTATDKFISMGLTAAYNQTALNVDTSGLDDGYAIKEQGGNFYIVGGPGAKAYLYAAYDFLKEAINFEPYYLDEVTFDYKLDITMPSIDMVVEPTFISRSYFNHTIRSASEPAVYQNYIRYEEVQWTSKGNAHTIFSFLPPTKYYEEHSEWYTGVSDRDQLCWSQESMVEELANQVILDVQGNPDATHVMISQNDGRQWCSCTKCAASLQKYGTNSAVLVQGINKIARKLKAWLNENQPGRVVYVTTFAYTSTANPAVKFDQTSGKYLPIDDSVMCDDNVAIRIAPIDTDYSRNFEDEINQAYAQMFYGWAVLCENLLVWNYNTNFNYYFVPFCNFNVIKDNYVFFKENNVNVVFENGGHMQTGFWEMRVYMTSKLQWNCNLNSRELIEDFMENYYKDGSSYMYKYFEEYRQWYNVIENKYTLINGDIYARYGSVEDVFPQALIDRWEGYVHKAMQEIEYIKDIDLDYYNKLYTRMEKETLFFDYVRLFNYTTSYTDAELLSMRLEFRDKCNRHSITHIQETGKIDSVYTGWGI